LRGPQALENNSQECDETQFLLPWISSVLDVIAGRREGPVGGYSFLFFPHDEPEVCPFFSNGVRGGSNERVNEKKQIPS